MAGKKGVNELGNYCRSVGVDFLLSHYLGFPRKRIEISLTTSGKVTVSLKTERVKKYKGRFFKTRDIPSP